MQSGILRDKVAVYIGNGVVLSPQALFEEIDTLEQMGVNVASRLSISEACPVIMPHHVALDRAREAAGLRVGVVGFGERAHSSDVRPKSAQSPSAATNCLEVGPPAPSAAQEILAQWTLSQRSRTVCSSL